MERTVWKYELTESMVTTLRIPHGGEILCMQLQGDVPCIWALVDPSNKSQERHFEIYGTGWKMDEAKRKYIGTFPQLDGRLIFHVFERLDI